MDVQTRAGIHTGECERIGDDIAGIAVHIASRVEGRGTARRRRGHLDGPRPVGRVGPALRRDRRRAPLKGVPGEWRLFEVAA